MNTYNSSEPYSIACTLPHALSARQDCSLANTVKRIVPSDEVCLATRAPFLHALHIPHRHPAKWVLLLSHFRDDKTELQNDRCTAPDQGAARCWGRDGSPGSPTPSTSRLGHSQSALPTESVCSRRLLRCLFLLPFIVFGFWTITTDKRYSSDSTKLTRKKHLDRKRR